MESLFYRMPGLCGPLYILIVLMGTVGCVEERTTSSSLPSPYKWVTAFEQLDESPLMKRKLLSTIQALGKQWRVSFEVFPENFNHKGLASVLHMMTGEKGNRFGKHIPAVWIHRSKAIFVSTSLGKKSTFTRRFRSNVLAIRNWTRIEVSQSRQGENHLYAVKIGGKQVFLTKNTRPRDFYDVKVYAASPSSSPLAGSIRNIKIDVGEPTETQQLPCLQSVTPGVSAPPASTSTGTTTTITTTTSTTTSNTKAPYLSTTTTSTCSTISGADPDAECSFPFIFMGTTWTGCTTVDGDPTPWCITQTDTNGNPITDEQGIFNTWGYCHSSCPIDQGPPPPPPSTCSTISGADPECSFPFIFYGITWTGCTTVDEPADNPQPWCITQTDANGYPLLDGNGQFTTWGYCHSSCPIDQGSAHRRKHPDSDSEPVRKPNESVRSQKGSGNT